MPNSRSVSAPSVGVGPVLGTLELEDVVVVVELLDGTLLVVEDGLGVVVVVVVVDDVVAGAADVTGFLVVVGDGGGVLVDSGAVEVVFVCSEEPKTHSPTRVPTLGDAKWLNNPSEKSRPPNGHPGHSSMTVA